MFTWVLIGVTIAAVARLLVRGPHLPHPVATLAAAAVGGIVGGAIASSLNTESSWPLYVAGSLLPAVGAAVGICVGVAPTSTREDMSAGPGWSRGLAYLLGSTLITVWAFNTGGTHDTLTVCRYNDVADCDLGFIEGTAWAIVAVALCALVVASAELSLLKQRKRLLHV